MLYGLPSRIVLFVQTEMDRYTLLSVLSPVVFLCLWEVLAQFSVINPQFFPPPTSIFTTGIDLAFGADAELFGHVSSSLSRILLGFAGGSITGISLGLLMGWSDKLYVIADPIVSALYPIPKIVLLPIIFLIFGLTETSRIFALGMAVFMLVIINTTAGARDIDQEYLQAAKDNGASGFALIREVIFPASLPYIFSGLSLAMGVGFILVVVIEMIAAESGLGYMIWNSWQLFTVQRMYVAILTINVLGVVFIYGIEWVGRYMTRWQE